MSNSGRQIGAGYPALRMRRLRRDDFTRRMVREHRLSADNLIYPVFVVEGTGVRQPVASMPGVERRSPDTVLELAESCVSLGVPVIALHGTSNPASVGQAASNGCVRMPNEVVSLLYDQLPLGTQVEITA